MRRQTLTQSFRTSLLFPKFHGDNRQIRSRNTTGGTEATRSWKLKRWVLLKKKCLKIYDLYNVVYFRKTVQNRDKIITFYLAGKSDKEPSKQLVR